MYVPLVLASCVIAIYTRAANGQACTQECQESNPGLCQGNGGNANQCENHCSNKEGTCGSECKTVDGSKNEYCFCKYTAAMAKCSGEPHYLTFDKARHHYQGLCRLTAVKQCQKTDSFPTFAVGQQNRAWRGGPYSIIDRAFLDVKEWRLSVSIQTTNPESPAIKVNGRQVTLPHKQTFSGKYPGFVSIVKRRMAYYGRTYEFTYLETSFGVTMQIYYHVFFVYIPKHPELRGNTCGVYGKWDDDSSNDLTDGNGVVHPYSWWAWDFGNSWCESASLKVHKNAQRKAEKNLKDTLKACEKDTGRKRRAAELCEPLRSRLFGGCAEASSAYDDCVTDVCVSKGRKDQVDMACGAVQSANIQCRKDVACAEY